MKKRSIKQILAAMLVMIMVAAPITMPAEIIHANDWSSLGVDVGELDGTNWMGGISGERYLHEINIPGSHDSCMKNAWTAYLYAKAGYNGAITQKHYIPEQLQDGIRMFDIRLTDYARDNWKIDDESVWVTHGQIWNKLNLIYYGCDENDYVLRFDNVIENFCDFLRVHPTETLIVMISPESGNANKNVTYSRAKNVVDKWEKRTNYATGKSFIYTDSDGGTYDMPKLGDTRGQIVLLSDSPSDLGYGMRIDTSNGYGSTTIGGVPFDYENHYEAKDKDKEKYLKVFYDGGTAEAGAGYDTDEIQVRHTRILNTNDEHLERGIFINTSSNRIKRGDLFQLPKAISEYINPVFFTNADAYISERGMFYGWIGSDFVDKDTAKAVWMTNYRDLPSYHTVTYRASEEASGEKDTRTYKRLYLSDTVLNSCTFEHADGVRFAGWKLEGTQKICKPGDLVTVNKDLVFIAQWSMSWTNLQGLIARGGNNAEITLTTDITADPNNSEILIGPERNVRINLNGHTIDGVAEDALSPRSSFCVYGNLTIVGPGTIKGGSGITGGAFAVSPGGSLVLDGVTVTGNTAQSSGGAIYLASLGSKSGRLTLKDTVITGNQAKICGGGIYKDTNADVTLSGTVKITDNQTEAGMADNLCLNKIDEHHPVNIDPGNGLTSDSRIGVCVAPGLSGGQLTFTSGVRRYASITNFISDDTRYRIEKGSDKEAALSGYNRPGSGSNLLDAADVQIAPEPAVLHADVPEEPEAAEQIEGMSDEQDQIILDADSPEEPETAEQNEGISDGSDQVIFDADGPEEPETAEQNTGIPDESDQIVCDTVDPEDQETAESDDLTPSGAYTVVFKAGDLGEIPSQTVYYAGFASEPDISIPPEKNLIGWYELIPGFTESELKELLEGYDIPENMFWIDGSDVLMWFEYDYPIFTDTELRLRLEDKQCTVNLIDNGSVEETLQIKYGTILEQPEALPGVLGYESTGWYDDPEGKTPHDFSKPVTDDLDVYAIWKAMQNEVSFDSVGGSTVETQKVLTWNKAVKPEDPARKGFVFAGWYETVATQTSESEFKDFLDVFPDLKDSFVFDGGNAYFRYDFDSVVFENVKLTALWTDLPESVMKAAGKTVSVIGGVKGKLYADKTISAKKTYTISGSEGKLTYKKANTAGNSKIKVDSATGKIILKKGLPTGQYKVKIKVTDTGGVKHAPGEKNVTVTIKVANLPKSVMKAAGKTVSVTGGVKGKLNADKTISAKKAYTISGSEGKLTYKKVNTAGNSRIKVDSATGKITLKKGLPTGQYKVKIKVTDTGGVKHAPGEKNVTVTIKVSKK